MSLINDALKRAQDAQQRSPAPGPQFRPAEPAPAPKHGIGLMVPVIIAVLVFATLVFIWQSRQKTAARELLPATKPLTPPPEHATPAPVQVAATSVPAAPIKPAPASPTPTPAPAPAAPVAPPVPELKLQAIIFSPTHPTAMISGKTVRIGDKIRTFRVSAITETSTTLVSATETNVMTLDQ